MNVALAALASFVAIVVALAVVYRRTKARVELEEAERVIRLHRRSQRPERR